MASSVHRYIGLAVFDFEMLGKIDIFVIYMSYFRFFKTINSIDRQSVHDLKSYNTLMLVMYLE